MSTVSLKSSSKSDKSHIEIILSLSAFSVRAWFGIRLTRHTVKSSVANGNSPDKLRHTRSVAYSVRLVLNIYIYIYI